MTIKEAEDLLKHITELGGKEHGEVYLELPFPDRPYAPKILIVAPGSVVWVAFHLEGEGFTPEQEREHRCMREKFGQQVFTGPASSETVRRLYQRISTYRKDYDLIADGLDHYQGE